METFFIQEYAIGFFFCNHIGPFDVYDSWCKDCPSDIKPLMINVLHLCKAWHNTMRFHLAMHTNNKKSKVSVGRRICNLPILTCTICACPLHLIYAHPLLGQTKLHARTCCVMKNETMDIFYVWCSSGQPLMMIILAIPCLKMHKTRTTWLLYGERFSLCLFILPT